MRTPSDFALPRFIVALAMSLGLLGGAWWMNRLLSAPAISSVISHQPHTGTPLPSRQSSTPEQISPAASSTLQDEQSENKKPEDAHIYFITSPDYVSHPVTEDWIVIDISPHDTRTRIDITGWTVRSLESGKSFTIGTVQTKWSGVATTTRVVLGGGDPTAAFIHTVGSPAKSYAAEVEFHLYFGETDVAWGKNHDTIQFVDSSGVVVDTYSY
jgi:hypothetical protein